MRAGSREPGSRRGCVALPSLAVPFPSPWSPGAPRPLAALPQSDAGPAPPTPASPPSPGRVQTPVAGQDLAPHRDWGGPGAKQSRDRGTEVARGSKRAPHSSGVLLGHAEQCRGGGAMAPSTPGTAPGPGAAGAGRERRGAAAGSGQSWRRGAGDPQNLVSLSALRLAWKREQRVGGGHPGVGGSGGSCACTHGLDGAAGTATPPRQQDPVPLPHGNGAGDEAVPHSHLLSSSRAP